MTRHQPAQTGTADDLMSPAQVRAYLGCGEKFLRVHGHEMGAFKLAGLWRVQRSDLLAWKDRQRQAAQPPVKIVEPQPIRRLDRVTRDPDWISLQ
jgi:hypothetical protein